MSLLSAPEHFQRSDIDLGITAADFRKRILKLRWIGLEAEAMRLARAFSEIAPEECAVLWNIETD